MSIIKVLIICGLIVSLLFLGLFIKAIMSGQFDDCETPALRILDREKFNSKNETE